MPLTFAHPAAVLPMMRGPLVPAALVAGAMSPDVPYFLRAARLPVTAQSWYEPFVNGSVSHAFPGALTVAVPTALLLHLGMRLATRPVAGLLPQGARPRPRGGPALRRAVWVVISLVIGVLTHLLWDSFTHDGVWLVPHVPVLADPLLGSMTGARVLQHLSSVVGLVLIGVALWRRRYRLVAPRGSTLRRGQLGALAAASAAAVLGAALVVASRSAQGVSVELLLGGAAIGAGLGVALVGLAAAACWWVFHLVRRTAR